MADIGDKCCSSCFWVQWCCLCFKHLNVINLFHEPRYIPQIGGVWISEFLRNRQMAQMYPNVQGIRKSDMLRKHVIKRIKYQIWEKVRKAYGNENGKDNGLLLWWLPCACCKWCPGDRGENNVLSHFFNAMSFKLYMSMIQNDIKWK